LSYYAFLELFSISISCWLDKKILARENVLVKFVGQKKTDNQKFTYFQF